MTPQPVNSAGFHEGRVRSGGKLSTLNIDDAAKTNLAALADYGEPRKTYGFQSKD